MSCLPPRPRFLSRCRRRCPRSCYRPQYPCWHRRHHSHRRPRHCHQRSPARQRRPRPRRHPPVRKFRTIRSPPVCCPPARCPLVHRCQPSHPPGYPLCRLCSSRRSRSRCCLRCRLPRILCQRCLPTRRLRRCSMGWSPRCPGSRQSPALPCCCRLAAGTPLVVPGRHRRWRQAPGPARRHRFVTGAYGSGHSSIGSCISPRRETSLTQGRNVIPGQERCLLSEGLTARSRPVVACVPIPWWLPGQPG